MSYFIFEYCGTQALFIEEHLVILTILEIDFKHTVRFSIRRALTVRQPQNMELSLLFKSSGDANYKQNDVISVYSFKKSGCEHVECT